jgi:environmental stress-induced protein Ves
MADIVTPDRFVTSPWKNGGGVTHEIARAEDAGRWLWRLSVAEVAGDGPFSRFEGMSRILTVIEGAGMELRTPVGVLRALPLVPVAFAGDLPVEGRLLAGPLRDLNVIYDARRVAASVGYLRGPVLVEEASLVACLVLAGRVEALGQEVPRGACVLGEGVSVTLAAGAEALLVRLAVR